MLSFTKCKETGICFKTPLHFLKVSPFHFISISLLFSFFSSSLLAFWSVLLTCFTYLKMKWQIYVGWLLCNVIILIFRSSHQSCSIKKMFLEVSQNSQENICARVSFLIKKRLWHRCFPTNFAKFLRTPFLQNTSGRLLLDFINLG